MDQVKKNVTGSFPGELVWSCCREHPSHSAPGLLLPLPTKWNHGIFFSFWLACSLWSLPCMGAPWAWPSFSCCCCSITGSWDSAWPQACPALLSGSITEKEAWSAAYVCSSVDLGEERLCVCTGKLAVFRTLGSEWIGHGQSSLWGGIT